MNPKDYNLQQRNALLCGAISGVLAYLDMGGLDFTREEVKRAAALARFGVEESARQGIDHLSTKEALLELGEFLMKEAQEGR